MAEDRQIVAVDAERLARLRRAVSLAAEGAFADASAVLGFAVEDDFGAVEQALQTFIAELKIAIEQSDVALNDVIASRNDVIASREEIQRKLTTIEHQQATIRELSTPIIDVWDGVLTVPLIGLIDGERVQDLTKQLLDRIPQSTTRWVLLDLTGIEIVDTNIATHLMKLATAIRLMGAKCLLTGIRPRVAQTFVALDVQFEGLRPMATLRNALEFCIASGARSAVASREAPRSEANSGRAVVDDPRSEAKPGRVAVWTGDSTRPSPPRRRTARSPRT
jgi:rsbT co-antagonist protein RsbR